VILSFAIASVAISAFLYRQMWFERIPLPPPGSDVAEFAAVPELDSVPREENAFFAYERAAQLIPEGTPMSAVDKQWPQRLPFLVGHWLLEPDAKREPMRSSLEAWRKASKLSRIAWRAPGEQSDAFLARWVLTLASMEIAEAKRAAEQGDHEQAWSGWLAVLRAALHVGHVHPTRAFSASTADYLLPEVQNWAADPGVPENVLRRAIRESLEARALEAPIEPYIAWAYRMTINPTLDMDNVVLELVARAVNGESASSLNASAPLQRVRLFLENEPERAKRVARLVFARWLDHLRADPAALARGVEVAPVLEVFGMTATTPREISDEVLRAQIADSRVFALFRNPEMISAGAGIERDRDLARKVALALAYALFEREHEGQPPSNLGALRGPYYPSDESLPRGTRDQETALPW
jgi:hypothetical protein